MRAPLGYILALALFAAPALAGTNGPDDRGSAAGSDSSSTASSNSTAKPDTPSTESELEELRVLLDSQSKQLQDQSDQLKATQEKMETLEKQIKAKSPATNPNSTPSRTLAPPADFTSTASAGVAAPAPEVPAADPSSSSNSADPQATPATNGVSTVAPTDTIVGLPPTYGTNPAQPEPQTSSPLSFRIGGAEFTPGGFMDLTDVFRTKSNGGSIGTNFSGILYKVPGNYPLAGSTEDKFSPQNSRISLRVDSTVAGAKVVGYIETDFLGNAASSLNTTSNSATLRMRLYFIDYWRGHFEFLGGQDWSMFTSNRDGIGFMPADVFYTQDMDTNYQLGLLWERTPQFRFIYHPNNDWAMGISMEDPDQYIASGYSLPAGLTSSNPVLGQFDPVAATPNTPNLLPDIVTKIAFDHLIGGKHMHIEAAADFRTFRLVNYTNDGAVDPVTFTGNTITNGPSNKVEGVVGAINSNWELFKNFHLIENIDWGAGAGRLIANTGVPDFIVRPVTPGATTGPYTLSPLHAGAFVGGFEWQATPKFLIYGYEGGVYISKYIGLAARSQFGWGVSTPAASTAEAQNRFLQEPTLGIIITMWRNPEYGALQLITQASYVQRSPWAVVPGTPTVATNTMAWADVRYTLP